MKALLSIWKNRIAPLFDVSQTALLVTVSEEQIELEDLVLDFDCLSEGLKFFTHNNIDVLVCGAISESIQLLFEQHGITVFSFVCGPTEIIIDALINQRLETTTFLMPGCRKLRHQHRAGKNKLKG